VTKYPEYQIFNLDKLTYAGNLANLTDIENQPNYTFVKGDLVDAPFVDALLLNITSMVLSTSQPSHMLTVQLLIQWLLF
jgi:dTDP-D-glucose 4,6-dehydratase